MRESGYTLVELVIAVLLIAVMTGPMMSVSLTARMSAGRTDRRMAAASAVRRLSENLKAYVTADRSLALGPGVGFDGWTLPGDMNGGYALSAGHHEVDAAQWLAALQPFSGRLRYDVATRQTPVGPQPDVTFTVTWNEP